MDMGSDAYMIRFYLQTGDSTSAYVVLIFILAVIFCQMLITFIQNKKRGWRDQVYEQAIVFFCLKAGVDAHRVAAFDDDISNKSSHDVLFDPHLEMTMCRSIEIGKCFYCDEKSQREIE